MKTRAERAMEVFDSGFNCAQSVVSAFCEDYGLTKEQAFKISGGMGGGFRSGEICGAVSGAVIIIGLRYGQHKDGDKEAKVTCGKKTADFISAYKAKHPAIICRDIIDPQADGASRRKICEGMVKSAVELLEEQGY